MRNILLAIFTLTVSLSANSTIGRDAQAAGQSYRVYLFYDESTQELREDRFVDTPVQLVDQRDTLSYDDRASLPEEGRFIVQLSSNEYVFSDTIKYDRQSGSFQILVPYYPHVQSIRVANSEAEDGFILSVGDYAQCNQNGVCEIEQGENALTCMSDCTGDSAQFSDTTQQSLRENQGVIRDLQGTPLLEIANDNDGNMEEFEATSESQTSHLYLLGGIILIAGALAGWVLVHFRR